MKPRALVGLIGANIGKSLSPALHEDAFAAHGIVGHYHLMDVDRLQARTLPQLFDSARAAGFAGINITYPFKQAVLALLDEVSPDARQIGAVNTVVFAASGRAVGANTDRSGFRRSFEESLGRTAVAGRTTVLVGAGGAGRAVAFALFDLGARHVVIHDVDGARSRALAGDLASHFGVGCARATDSPLAELAEAAGIVNATPVGMLGIPGLPLSTDQIAHHHWVADVIYTPMETELIQAARAKGCRVLTGGGMCVHQAADAFRLFSGLEPDVTRMHATFLEALAERDATLAS